MRTEPYGLGEAERNELAAFYEETRERTAAMICKLLGVSFAEHRALAEDLTQEVYLKVIRYRKRFLGQPEELRWGNLVMMIRNVVSNYRRHAAKLRFTSATATSIRRTGTTGKRDRKRSFSVRKRRSGYGGPWTRFPHPPGRS